MLTHDHSRPLNPSRVVILGARGFLAPALDARLRTAGIESLALGSASIDLTQPAAGPLLAAALRPADAVVMTAALTPEKGRDLGTTLRNLQMAESLSSALGSAALAHIVYISSDAVYSGPAEVFSEETPACPLDLYGLMHRARELALTDAADKAKVPFCVLRPCAIFGPGDTHNSYGPNRFARTAHREGKIRIFGMGEDVRDHVYIHDVVSVLLLTLLHRSRGILNVVSGQPVSFAALARQISDLAAGAAIESLPRASAVTHRRFDPSCLARSFPNHRPTPLADGLKETLAALAHE